jgi:hypothetical protein
MDVLQTVLVGPSAEAETNNPAEEDLTCLDGTKVYTLADCFGRRKSTASQSATSTPTTPTSGGGPPSQQAALGPDDLGGLKPPYNAVQLAAMINQCNTGKCTCSSFPISKVPVYDINEVLAACAKYPVDPDNANCLGSFRKYNDNAGAYNSLSKKTCPQKYSDN